jgi:hypothetical protein
VPTCIYCLELRDTRSFSKSEHVLQKAFGGFKDTLVLRGVVCDDCNTYFGETIDLALSRDTLEGRMRFRYGILSSRKFKSLGKRSRIEVKATEGVYEGMMLEERHSEEKNEIVVAPVRQIGVKKKDG